MGKHGDPNRRDTNPLHGLFRTFEPGHTGFQPDPEPPADPEPDNTGDGDRWEDPRDTIGGDETTEIHYGRSPAYPAFEEDPDPYPGEPDDVEPPPDVNLAEYETTRRPRPWLGVLAVSGALSAVVLAGWLGRTTAPSEPVSDRYSAVQTPSRVTVTATVKASAKATAGPKRGGSPRPTVTAWRTRTPEPRVIVSRVPVPGPTVRITRTAQPKPAPTKTVTKIQTITERCTVTITVRRDGTVLSEETSGDC